MSTKIIAGNNSRLLRFKGTRVRSSRKVCSERLACRGKKPYAVFYCEQCHSNQCEVCEALLHEDFRLFLHDRQQIRGPPLEELCEGSCEDRNFADLTCSFCDKNYCLVCDHIVHVGGKQTHTRTKFTNPTEEFLSCDEFSDEYFPHLDNFSCANEESSYYQDNMMSFSSHLEDALPDLFPEHEIETLESKYNKKSKRKGHAEVKSFLLINDKEALQVLKEFISAKLKVLN